jgi:hypothetical protein
MTTCGDPFGKKSAATSFIAALRPKVIKGRAGLARPDNQVQTHRFEQSSQFPYAKLLTPAALQGR